MSNKNKIAELKNIAKLIDISHKELLEILPDTKSRNYKANLKKCITKLMQHELEISETGIINLLKIVDTKIHNIKSAVKVNLVDMRDLKKEHSVILYSYRSYIEQRYETSLDNCKNNEMAFSIVQYEINNTASYNSGTIQLYKNADASIKSKYCSASMDLKKNELTIKLLKKIRYHLHYCLAKYC